MPESVETNMSTRSVDHQPSGTALATATMRALAAHDERKEIRGPDYLAETFLTEDRRSILKDSAKRQWVLKNKITPGAYEFMIARTAFFDAVVKQALGENVPQLVFLGAGYDTRPYRFRDVIQRTRIFELDAPPTQQRKQKLLEQASIPIPAQLAFVPVNFNIDNLREVLLGAGFETDQRSLFVWEGVTYYLSAEVVDDTLSCVSSCSPPGSSMAFDYED